jgi:hypothetical protein
MISGVESSRHSGKFSSVVSSIERSGTPLLSRSTAGVAGDLA